MQSRSTPSIAELLIQVAQAFGTTSEAICGQSRQAHIALARHTAAWLIRQHWPQMSRSAIGQLLGGRDQATIRSALRHVEQQAAVCESYRLLLAGLRGDLHPALDRSQLDDPQRAEIAYLLVLHAAEVVAGRTETPLRATLVANGVAAEDCTQVAALIKHIVATTLAPYATAIE
jgi:Bacterial dnaA protein helix-turn-helix